LLWSFRSSSPRPCPLSVATYAGTLWALGGLDREVLDLFQRALRRERSDPGAALSAEMSR